MRIGDSPNVFELEKLLKWRTHERARHDLEPCTHSNPLDTLPYEVADLLPVRYNGMPEPEYNDNIRSLNALRTVHGLRDLVHMTGSTRNKDNEVQALRNMNKRAKK